MDPAPNLKVLPRSRCDLDFGWYEMIREELLRRTIPEGSRVLDVGCGTGAVLCMLSGQIKCAVGVDISEGELAHAQIAQKQSGIENLEFRSATATDLPFPQASFDVVLCLGDVLSSSTLFGKQERALCETKRVLVEGGLAVYEGMNWEWEYAQSPHWTCFSRTGDRQFVLHRMRRTACGQETEQTYDVKAGTPLHKWVLDQQWPVSPSGHQVSLDIVETDPIPSRWLRFRGTNKYRFYTARALKRLYRKAGFQSVEVLSYGQTYDIVKKAGLTESLQDAIARLGQAEAELILEQRSGNGPWLYLLAKT